MPNSWRGKVFLPMERVVRTVEAALNRHGSSFQKSYANSWGRRVEVLSVGSPIEFTIRARESGLRFSYTDIRRETALLISTTAGSLPYLGSLVLGVARRFPRPPWKRDEVAKQAAHSTWRKVFGVSALTLVLGLANLFFAPLPSLALAMLTLSVAGIVVPVVLIILTHPEVESRIQRWRWSWWMEGPEFSSLGWSKEWSREHEQT